MWRGPSKKSTKGCSADSDSPAKRRRTMMKNAERIARYKRRMEASGFRRVSFWLHPELADLLAREQAPNECGGRTLERLLLGQARPRPGERGWKFVTP